MYRLKTIFLGMILAGSLCFFAGQTWFTAEYFRTFFYQQTHTTLQYQVEAQAAELNAAFSRLGKVSETLALTAALSNSDIHQLFATAKQAIAGEPLVYGAGFWFEPYQFNHQAFHYGPYIYKPQRNDHIELTWLYSTPEYNYFKQEWYNNAFLPTETSNWSLPYLDEPSGLFMITASSPILRGQERIGVASVDITIDRLQNTVRQIPAGQGGFAFILSPSGLYVGHSAAEKNLKQNIFDETDSGLRALGHSVLYKKTPGSCPAEVEHQPYRAYYSPVGNTGLLLVILYPQAELAAPWQHLQRWNWLTFALALLACIAFLYYIFQRRISRPLHRLAHAAELLGEGDLATPVPGQHQRDEIGQLALALEQMRLKLGHTFSEVYLALLQLQDRQARIEHAEQRYAALYFHMFDALLLLEADLPAPGNPPRFQVIDSNQAFADLVGCARPQLIGSTLTDVLPQLQLAEDDFRSFIERHDTSERIAYLPSAGKYMRIKRFEPAPQQVALIFYDISRFTLAEQKIQQQNEYLLALYETTLAIIRRTHIHDLLYAILERAAKMVGCTNGFIAIVEPHSNTLQMKLVLGESPAPPPDVLACNQGLIHQVFTTRQMAWVNDYQTFPQRLPHPYFAPIRAAVAVPLLREGRIIGIFALSYYTPDSTFSDASLTLLERFSKLAALALDNALLYRSLQQELAERRRTEEDLRYLAYHDTSVNLPNRNALHDTLSRYLAADKPLALFTIEVDGINLVNTLAGHAAGEQLLHRLGETLVNLPFPSPFVAKLNGNELALLLPETAEPLNLPAAAELIIQTCCQPWHISGQEFHLTANAGIARHPDDSRQIETLLANADIAMRQAKQTGKNTFCFFHTTLLFKTIDRLSLEKKLRYALQHDELQLDYQVRIDAGSRRIHGVEAILKWKHPLEGLIPPGVFLPLAEETGLILPLGNWMLRKACRQLKHWRSQGFAVNLAVNLTAAQFYQPQLRQVLLNIISNAEIHPSWLELEIAETLYMKDMESALYTLRQLRQLGIKITMDTFGTGQSSLVNLKQLPIDAIKIDRSFVQDTVSSQENSFILEAVTSLGHILQLTVAAEGIETAQQAALLAKLGIDELQGSYFAPPLPPAACTKLLAENREYPLAPMP